MEVVGRKWRIGVALGISAALGLSVLLVSMRLPASPPVAVARPEAPSAAAEPAVELGRLYALDHLVLEGDPVLDLDLLAAVGAGPNEPPPVPEPGAAMLWILGFAALYTLYVPAGSW